MNPQRGDIQSSIASISDDLSYRSVGKSGMSPFVFPLESWLLDSIKPLANIIMFCCGLTISSLKKNI